MSLRGLSLHKRRQRIDREEEEKEEGKGEMRLPPSSSSISGHPASYSSLPRRTVLGVQDQGMSVL